MHVDNSQITPLYDNTTAGVVADASKVDPAIAALVAAINTNYDEFINFVYALDPFPGTLGIPDQSIVERHLRNLAVTNPKLAPLAVTADKIADGSITLSKLADLVITAQKIANYTITEDKMATLSVSRRLIQPGAVGANEIDPTILNPIADAALNVRLNQIDEKLVVTREKKIYARDYGVKLDGVTDDTAALNVFFSHFGEGELIVDNGVALVTGQLNIPGLWRPDVPARLNSSVKRLTFVRASIKYTGPANKAVMQVYNHFTSIIDGVAITRDSNPTYINFAGLWYSKFINFDVPKLTFGYNNADITASLLSASSFVNVIEKGYINGPMEFYGVGVSGSSFINSMRINDVLFDGKSTNAYNIKFYGTSFENFSFNGCDVSYATTSVLYIDAAQTTATIHFDNCYFDTAIPMIEQFNYKGVILSTSNTREAAGTMAQAALCKTFNLMTGHRIAGRGHEPNNLPKGYYNYMYNGDLYLAATNGTWFIEQNTQGGAVAAKSWVANSNTIRGNALNVVFNANGQQQIFRGMNVPHTGVYTCGLRIKKNSGNAVVQISYASTNITYDLSRIPDGEEAILSSHGVFKTVTQGTQAAFSIVVLTVNAGANIDILEIFMIDGTYTGFNLPLHPKAQIYNGGPTANRPLYPVIYQRYIDSTLNKDIWWNGTVWKDAMGTTV